jgi:hypothetical protein
MKKRKLIRQKEALERMLVRQARTPKEQLRVSDKRLGRNIGAS